MITKWFVIQIIVSFVIGGGAIALLTIVAEKASQRIAGIILTFPVTAGMSIFFLGWLTSAEAVVKVIPSVFITLGVALLFISAYPHIALFVGRFVKNRILQVLISYFSGIGIWFILALPTIVFEFNNYFWGVIGYLLLNMLSHFILTRKTYEKPVMLTYTVAQKIGRAIFVGIIMSLVVLLGKVLTPFWGGMFTMFPAAFSSVLVIIHWYYGVNALFPLLRKVAIGSLSVFSYVNIVKFSFPKFGYFGGTIIAFAGSIVVSLFLIIILQNSDNYFGLLKKLNKIKDKI